MSRLTKSPDARPAVVVKTIHRSTHNIIIVSGGCQGSQAAHDLSLGNAAVAHRPHYSPYSHIRMQQNATTRSAGEETLVGANKAHRTGYGARVNKIRSCGPPLNHLLYTYMRTASFRSQNRFIPRVWIHHAVLLLILV